MLKRILVGLAGTPHSAVGIRHAVELAAVHGATVTGVTIVDVRRLARLGSVPVGAMHAAVHLREHRIHATSDRVEESMSAFEDACKQAGVPYEMRREMGDPFDLLLSLWRYHDLTILGLRGWFDYGAVEKPQDELVRIISHGVRSILAVPAEYTPVRRALVAYSGSEDSAKAMKRFAQLRLWPDVSVHVVTMEKPEEEGRTLVAQAAAYLRAHGFPVSVEQSPEAPEKGLLPLAAERGADIIVMGDSARSIAKRRVFGDIALDMVRSADCMLFLSH